MSEEVSIEQIRHLDHDLRSPLSTLRLLINSQPDLNSDKKNLLNQTLNRIQDMISTLFVDGQENIQEKASSHELIQLSTSLETLIEEKRITLPKGTFLLLKNELLNEIHFKRKKINSLKRIISNLVNNSSEAKKPFLIHIISIRIFLIRKNIHIEVVDNGKGIPKSIKNQLLKKGFSHDKPNGKGIGLYHAKRILDLWHGDIIIHSSPDIGTKVTIFFPIQPPERNP